ncbi:flagellar basal body rod C-terminal domain-containing protein [Caulobacter sp. Root655]|uniref:flagellar basal body rod C-terminal domain-containing protein n=1 Tax=Caulobacter sp. Root655 TaxID=1736578 RepID=UPI000A6487F9|nr:flagellar basal body rod C-terminal domain-containing protein [Caulobacter sp. Root655]
MQVLATAAAGMFAAADRLSASAQRTAAWGAEQAQAESKIDLAHEAVEQISAKTDFKANAEVAKTADEMTGALLDMKV